MEQSKRWLGTAECGSASLSRWLGDCSVASTPPQIVSCKRFNFITASHPWRRSQKSEIQAQVFQRLFFKYIGYTGSMFSDRKGDMLACFLSCLKITLAFFFCFAFQRLLYYYFIFLNTIADSSCCVNKAVHMQCRNVAANSNAQKRRRTATSVSAAHQIVVAGYCW